MKFPTSPTLFALALLLGVAPLWAGATLPLVDLPQHLHLISVLHRLDDPTTLYPELFEARATLTPYLGYYYLVSALNWLLPLELANRLFLSAYVAGMALGLAFLLRSLGRPAWPAALALPFAYGDSFAWGFINYCAALPLTFLTCGLFVRALTDRPRALRWAAGLAISLLAVLLFHVQAFAFLALALPFLLLTTRVREDAAARSLLERLRPRVPALLGVTPGVLTFLVWVGLRLGEPSEVEAGAPWKAWGPMLSPQNLAYKSTGQNAAEFFDVLANMLRDGSDRWALYAVGAVAAAATLLAIFGHGERTREGAIERWRMLGLGLIALGLYFALPFDIRGYMYYLNTRFAHLAAPLLIAAVPAISSRLQRPLLAAATLAALILAAPLVRGFRAFDAEASEVARLATAASERPMVMALVFSPMSAVVKHPVHLHAGATLARLRGGATNFSFALTPHSPLKYRAAPPPTFPSEWRPQQFSWEQHAGPYDHFLVRGAHPGRVFGQRLAGELEVVAQEGSAFLVRRR